MKIKMMHISNLIKVILFFYIFKNRGLGIAKFKAETRFNW